MKNLILTFALVAFALAKCNNPCNGDTLNLLGDQLSFKDHVTCSGGTLYLNLVPEKNYGLHGGYSVEGYPFRKTEYSKYPVLVEEQGNDCVYYLPAEIQQGEHGWQSFKDPRIQAIVPNIRQTWGNGYPDATEPHTKKTNFLPLGMAACCIGGNNPCGEAQVNIAGTGFIFADANKNHFANFGYYPAGETQVQNDYEIKVTGGGYCGDRSLAKIYLEPAHYQGKVRICHRTNAIENPYVSIEVSWDAADGDAGNDKGQGDHRLEHTGPLFDPAVHTKSSMDWGDIIAPIPGLGLPGVNWEGKGQTIWENNCNIPNYVPNVCPEALCGCVPGMKTVYGVDSRGCKTCSCEPTETTKTTGDNWDDIWNDISCGAESPQ